MAKAFKKVAIIASRLDLPGGIERSVVNISNLLQSHGYEVSLVILDKTATAFFPINENVKILHRHLHFGITPAGNILTRKISFLKHLVELNKIIKTIGPENIIATEYQFAITVWLATRTLNIKIISREAHHFHSLKKNRFWKYLFAKTYPKLDYVVCLNPAEKKFFDTMGCRTTVIPNYVLQQCKASLYAKNLLTIGRLMYVKGLDLIPGIAEKIAEKHKDWQWTIIGSGPAFENLKNDICSKNLQNHIRILNPQSPDLMASYLDASIYISTSRVECLGNVLLEAMSHGIPCVAFDCPTGPAYVIRHGTDGVLVKAENVTQMAEAISQLLTDGNKRFRLGEHAYKNIQRFSVEAIYSAWHQVLNG